MPSLFWVYPGSLTRALDRATWLETSAELRKLDWDVTLVASEVPALELAEGVRSVCLARPPIYFVGYVLFHLLVLLRITRYLGTIDVILCNQESAPFLLPIALFRRVLRRARPKVVMDWRTVAMNADFSTRGRIRKAFYRLVRCLANRLADGQTAITRRLAEAVGIPNRQLLGVWPSGVRVEQFSSAISARRWPRDQEPLRLVYVGALEAERNLLGLCDAVRLARKAGVGVTLDLVGDGSQRKELESYAREFGDGVIAVRPPVDRALVPGVLSSADVGVLPFPDKPQFHVSSPIKLFEYMAAGMPIVATRIVCHTDVLDNGAGVFWADDESPAALAAAIQQAAGIRKAERKRLAEKMAHAAHAWSWQASAKLLDDALRRLADDVLEEKPVPGLGAGGRRMRFIAGVIAVSAVAVLLALMTARVQPGISAVPKAASGTTNLPVLPWRPLVALSFDDTHDTAYTLAYPLLKHYGLEAGVVVITDLTKVPTRLSWAQITDLDKAGWDIMDGTQSHPDTVLISETQLDRELQVSQAIIESHIGTGKVRGLVWPYTDAGDQQMAVARHYFDWAAGGANYLDGRFMLRHGLPESQPDWPYKIGARVVTTKDIKNGGVTEVLGEAVDAPAAWLLDFERVEPYGAEGLSINVGDLQSVIEYLLANDAVIVKPSEFYQILRYGKPEFYQRGFELNRNRQLTKGSRWAGIPSSFEVAGGRPVWQQTGGPDQSGQLQVSAQSAFRTVELPVLAGGSYTFSFMHKAGGPATRDAVAVVELRDSSPRTVDTLRSTVSTSSDKWRESKVDFAVPNGVDQVRLAVMSPDSGIVLTSEWSLVRK